MVAILACTEPGQAVVDVYREVFAEPPYEEGERDVALFERRVQAHARRPRFTCLTAVDGDHMVGFSYGFVWFTAAPPSPWYAQLAAALGAPLVDRHLRGTLEVRELAVRAAWRGRGIGAALLDTLLTTAGADRAWLVVLTAAQGARRFYAAHGWHEIGQVGRDERVLVLQRPA